jgi:tRNA dimethylallyltransferase
MESHKSRIIVIVGPTASGKSDAAIRLAEAINGEVISADSRQVYRGMDIGTGKISGSMDIERGIFISEGIPHHLIDVVDPMEDFNVSHFKKLADAAIEDILQRGKVPIICGGTGFWVRALIDNMELPEVKPNEMLRSMLRNKSTEELFENLKKIDPERAENIEAKNKIRLIRAIEIASALGKVPSKSLLTSNRPLKYDILRVGISVPKEILDAKIKKRLDGRFDQGMIKEVEKLHDSGVTWEWMEKIGLEYRWIARFLQDKIPLDEMREKLYFDIIHYAKRQMTWFRKDKKILWVSDYRGLESPAKEFLGK